MAVAAQYALVMRGKFAVLENQLFNLRGEHIHPSNNHHVVAAARDFFNAPHGARRARQQA